MSRLIIKNLPPNTTPAHLRAHFTQHTPGAPRGELTDVQIAQRRRFGFVGYKTPEEAARAREWFDRTYVGSSRISVGVVDDHHDGGGRERKRRRVAEAKLRSLPPHEKPREHLEEFMQIMQPRTKKGPLWANDAPVLSAPLPLPAEPDPQPTPTPTPEQVEDGAAHDEAISDLEWMRRRIGGGVDVDAELVFEQSDDEDAPSKHTHAHAHESNEAQAHEEAHEADPTIPTIRETSRLFVRNLAFGCTQPELEGVFSPFGEVVQVHIPVDINTKQPKGVAYVTFKSPSSAVAAYEALDRTPFQGRLMHVLGAVDRRGAPGEGDGEGQGRKRTVKEEKHAKRKAAAGKEFVWSMLYMNADAVASSVADRMNIDKAAILNPEEGDNAAVKLALAETHIIAETKAFLESHGVDLSAFAPPPPSSTSSSQAPSRPRGRSDTTILVKNIPYGTTAAQIRELFEPHGALKRVLVPPAGTMALVEYERADEARSGFRAVAYRRLGNSVVYLEMAPRAVFREGAPAPGDSTSTGALPGEPAVRGKRIAEQEGVGAGVGEDGEEEDITGGMTLYIKNLAFSTTQERLAQTFRHLPSFAFARVQTKPDPQRPGGRLSMGYGFLGFKDVEGARKALGALRGFVLDGHELVVKFAGRGVEAEGAEKKGGKGGRTTKMVVKNVPFEATKKDIQALFGWFGGADDGYSTHGHLKSVRLPKKFDSRTRGFAFLDFVSRAEAENAYAALRHTHLLGRHLVLEWAEEGAQDVDELRRKAGVGFGDGRIVPGRKRKIELGKTGEEDVDALEV
ncbi:hypothetical protein C0992_005794 [Termitomyces sp. T32_za158]|nr:hypothetical protein C0992_005794 [Termitomyces sp. T32_za158]